MEASFHSEWRQASNGLRKIPSHYARDEDLPVIQRKDWSRRQKRHALKWYLGIFPIPPKHLRQAPHQYLAWKKKLADLDALSENHLAETQ